MVHNTPCGADTILYSDRSSIYHLDVTSHTCWSINITDKLCKLACNTDGYDNFLNFALIVSELFIIVLYMFGGRLYMFNKNTRSSETTRTHTHSHTQRSNDSD